MGTLEDPRAMVLPEDRDERRLTENFRSQVCEHARSGGFLGPEVGAILTTEFDRVVHGVDCVFELRHVDRTASHLAVSFEVTVPWREPWDPFDEVRQELERDEVAPVEYFQSEWLDSMGGLRAPRVHLAFPMSSLLTTLGEREEDGVRLAGALVHLTLLRSIADQLAVFERFAAVRKREAALAHLRRTRADFLGRLDALGVREFLYAEEVDPEVRNIDDRLFEVFAEVLEDVAGAGPPE